MKRVLALVILCCMLMTACSNGSSERIDEFCDKAQGIWVNLDSCKEMGPDSISFSFVEFKDGGMTFGDYPGCYGATGTIVKVKETEKDEYEVIFRYEETDGAVMHEEGDVQRKICFTYAAYKTMLIDGKAKYHYMGADLEVVHEGANKRFREIAKDENDLVNDEIDAVAAEEARKLADEYLIKSVSRYDANGELVAIYTYEYDEYYRLKTLSYKFWNIVTDNFDKPTIEVYDYDSSGRIKNIWFVDDINQTTTDDWMEYSYASDGTSRANIYTNGRIEDKRVYNEKGQETEMIWEEDDYTYREVKEYNENGDIKEVHYIRTGKGESYNTKQYSYFYNKFGMKTMQMVDTGEYTTYEYDDNHCVVKVVSHKKDASINRWEERKYISKSDVQKEAEKLEQERESRKIILSDSIMNGADYSAYEELYSLTRTLNAEDMERFRGEWYSEDGSHLKVGLIGSVYLTCKDGDDEITIDGALQYVTTNIAMMACSTNGGLGYILFVYDYDDDTVQVQSLLVANNRTRIVGTYKSGEAAVKEDEGKEEQEAPMLELTGYLPYDKKLSEYAAAAAMSAEELDAVYGWESNDINTYMLRLRGEEILQYTLYDVDKNGVPELFVAFGNTIIDFFLTDGSVAIKPFEETLGYRSHLSVYSDGKISVYGSVSMEAWANSTYTIGADGQSVVLERTYYENSRTGENEEVIINPETWENDPNSHSVETEFSWLPIG